jgi:hypothetical protein
MTKAQLETKLRNTFLTFVTEQIQTSFDSDVLPVSASELAIPCVDDEGNEKFVLIKISIPRGTRNGEGGYDPYDGYAVAQDYAQDCVEKAQKKAEAEAKKKAKIAKDEQKRAEKKALAEANKNLKELRKIKVSKPQEKEGDNYVNEYAPHELADMLN